MIHTDYSNFTWHYVQIWYIKQRTISHATFVTTEISNVTIYKTIF